MESYVSNNTEIFVQIYLGNFEKLQVALVHASSRVMFCIVF